MSTDPQSFLDWLVGMDDPDDTAGLERRRTITLTQIIDRAREAKKTLAAPLDLTPYRHPRYSDEWHYGTAETANRSGLPAVVGYRSPDEDGDTVWLYRRGWARDDLLELIAFLTAVHAASDPALAEAEVAT